MIRVAVGLAILLLGPEAALSAPIGYVLGTPTVTLQFGGTTDTRAVATTTVPSGGNDIYSFDEALTGANGTGIEILGTLNPAPAPDPFIAFTVNAANFSASQLAYSVALNLPVSGGPFTSATSQLSGTLTDLDGNGVASSFISGQTLLNSVALPALTLGAPYCEAGAETPGATLGCGPFGPVSAAVTGDVSLLTLELSFTLTQRDLAAYTGTITLGTAAPPRVPEPASAMLMAGGLLVAWWSGRRGDRRARPTPTAR